MTENCHFKWSSETLMWVFHHTTKAPDLGFLRVGFKNMLSPRLPVRVGCGRLRPCEKSNMSDISPDPNRLFFPAINKMSSPRLPQASSDQIYTVLCCPRLPATLSRRPLVPDPLYLSPRLPATLSPIAKQKSAISVWGRLGTPQDTLWGRDLILG